MDVHARPVVSENRLGHKGRGLAVRPRDVFHDVLVNHDRIRHAGQRRVAHINFALARATNFVMVHFDRHASLNQAQDNLRAKSLCSESVGATGK